MLNSRRVGVCNVRKAHRGLLGLCKSCCALIRVREISNSREAAELVSYLANVSGSRTSRLVQFCTGTHLVRSASVPACVELSVELTILDGGEALSFAGTAPPKLPPSARNEVLPDSGRVELTILDGGEALSFAGTAPPKLPPSARNEVLPDSVRESPTANPAMRPATTSVTMQDRAMSFCLLSIVEPRQSILCFGTVWKA